ncbi:MAG: IclR family transcriptional regulator [Dethiobacter sp.]|jgi:DNA-binding IclR family transcriptional regulator|nr:IclR family transcriptional regulator [Dethiobacter sp.]
MLKVANRTLEVLEFICDSPDKEFSVKELSKKFEVDKASIFRTLRVLTARGYLQQNERAGNYSLGLKLPELGAKVTAKIGLLDVIFPYMQKISQEINETINFAVMESTNIVYLHKIESSHFLRTDLLPGTSIPAYCSALGKAMLAWYEKEEVEKRYLPDVFKPRTAKTLVTIESFLKELQNIRETGYAVDDEEFIMGITCVAAPILNQNRKAIAAISVAGPTIRIQQKIPEIGARVSFYAREISKCFGCRD